MSSLATCDVLTIPPATSCSVRVFSPCNERHLVLHDLAIPLGEKMQMIIGSDPAASDVVLLGARVNSQHAMVLYHNGCYFIRDLGTLHGTYVNGRRVEQTVELKPGDEIRIKPYSVHFR